jgi:hypothetical protein
MKPLPGQAAGQAGRIIGAVLTSLGYFVLAVVSVLLIGFCLLAYRLSLGPVQIPYLASALATAASGQGVNIHIKDAALAWAGYRQGGGTPLYLQLGQITARNAKGVALVSVPDARMVFLPSALLGSRAPILVNSSDARFNGSDVPVSVRAAIRLSAGFRLSQADVLITLGPGRAGAGGNSEPISGGAFAVHLTPHDAALSNGEIDLARVGGSAPVVVFTARFHLDQVWTGSLSLGADRVEAGDLAAYWPPLLAVQTRHWVTTNITAGTARDAHLVLHLSAPRGLDDVSLTGATGAFAGDRLTLSWIPHAVPITNLSGKLTLQDEDTIFITADHAELGGLKLHDGTMRITGVSKKDQTGVVKLGVAGSVAAALAIFTAPPLDLLADGPPELAHATGDVTAEINTTLPLKNKLALADVQLGIDAKLSNLAVPTPVSGVGFTGGALTLRASTTALSVDGTAQLAGEPAAISARADFRAAQRLRHLDFKSAISPAALQGLGLTADSGVTESVAGAVPVELVIDPVKGTADHLAAVFTADLTPARLGVPVLGWAKAEGTAGRLEVAATLTDNQLSGIDSVDATAPGLAIHGQVAHGTVYLRQVVIGRTRAQGEVIFPVEGQAAGSQAGAAPWRIELAGPMLDLRAVLPRAKGAEVKETVPDSAPPSGPAWRASLNFSSLALAAPPAPMLRNLVFNGTGKGGGVLSADASASTDAASTDASTGAASAGAASAGAPAAAAGPAMVHLIIKPVSANGARRSFHLDAADGATLLRALAAFDNLQDGALDIDGTYGAGAAFTGTASLQKFRILQAPAIGKVLQALTVYGAAEAASGPGLYFSRLLAPFSISHQVLTLDDARAYSASLGFTASGTVRLVDGVADLDTTIIPAYALNTLPGKIPVIGKLFSAEKGGGLISVRVKITGQLMDPVVRVNPLSVLTPGALRGVFGIGGKPAEGK